MDEQWWDTAGSFGKHFNQEEKSLNVIPWTRGTVCQWPWEMVVEWHRVLSVLGGIVSFVGIPYISPLLGKGGILIYHITAVFFTEAAFSPVCSRCKLSKCKLWSCHQPALGAQHSGNYLLRLHLSKTAVAIRFLLPTKQGEQVAPCSLMQSCTCKVSFVPCLPCVPEPHWLALQPSTPSRLHHS